MSDFHNPRACPECLEMTRQGTIRIIDVLGHAGYVEFSKVMEGFPHYTLPPRWSQVREAWAQAAAEIGSMWSGDADADAADLDQILARVNPAIRAAGLNEETLRDALLDWRDDAVHRAQGAPARLEPSPGRQQ